MAGQNLVINGLRKFAGFFSGKNKALRELEEQLGKKAITKKKLLSKGDFYDNQHAWVRKADKESKKAGSNAWLKAALNDTKATVLKSGSRQLSAEGAALAEQAKQTAKQKVINDAVWNRLKLILKSRAKKTLGVGALTGGLGLGFYGAQQHINALPSNVYGFEPTDQDSINYVNFFMSPEERAKYGSDDDYLREIYNSASNSDLESNGIKGNKALARKAVPYVLNQVLNMKSIPQNSISEDQMKQIYAVSQSFRPSWNDARKQLQDKGYVEWAVSRDNNNGKYPAYKLFKDGKDGNGNDVSQASGWGTLGLHTVRWYPDKGLVYMDTYDFNPDAIEDSKQVMTNLAKENNLKDTTPSRTNLKLMKLALEKGLANTYGESIADPTKHSNVTWTLSPQKIRNFNN